MLNALKCKKKNRAKIKIDLNELLKFRDKKMNFKHRSSWKSHSKESVFHFIEKVDKGFAEILSVIYTWEDPDNLIHVLEIFRKL